MFVPPSFWAYIFQSTLPAGGATVCDEFQVRYHKVISIHAPRGGSDVLGYAWPRCPKQFQSTLPAGGATIKDLRTMAILYEFQSTLPAGGATRNLPATYRRNQHFNPRSPRGERLDVRTAYEVVHRDISIHAPRGGSDLFSDKGDARRCAEFQSTLPAGGATRHRPRAFALKPISIHAPRGGSDALTLPGWP